MANGGRPTRKEIEPLRVRTWVRFILMSTGASSPFTFAKNILKDESKAKIWAGYFRGDHSPNGPDKPGSSVAIAETHAPGSSRLYLSPMWRILGHETFSRSQLDEQFFALPLHIRQFIMGTPDSKILKLRDFSKQVRLDLCKNLSFGSLEALMLLALHARAIGSKQLAEAVADTFHHIQNDLRKLPELSQLADEIFPLLDQVFTYPIYAISTDRIDVCLPSSWTKQLQTIPMRGLISIGTSPSLYFRICTGTLSLGLFTCLSLGAIPSAGEAAILSMTALLCAAVTIDDRIANYRRPHFSLGEA